MTTNYLNQIPEAMQRRIQPLEIGFPNENQKQLILKENIKKLTVGGKQVFDNATEAEELKTALMTAFGNANGLTTDGIMGDCIVKYLTYKIQVCIVSDKIKPDETASLT